MNVVEWSSGVFYRNYRVLWHPGVPATTRLRQVAHVALHAPAAGALLVSVWPGCGCHRYPIVRKLPRIVRHRPLAHQKTNRCHSHTWYDTFVSSRCPKQHYAVALHADCFFEIPVQCHATCSVIGHKTTIGTGTGSRSLVHSRGWGGAADVVPVIPVPVT